MPVARKIFHFRLSRETSDVFEPQTETCGRDRKELSARRLCTQRDVIGHPLLNDMRTDTCFRVITMGGRDGVYCVFLLLVTVLRAEATDPALFRSNDTLLGEHVPCTDAEKACFRYNRILDPVSGKCYRLGSRGPCLDSTFLLDRNEFQESGRLVGLCQNPGECADHRFRMAFDGKCYTSNEVFGLFCDVKKGLLGWPYFFGGYECLCEGPTCPTPRYIEQPTETGRCLFPNFRKDLTSNFLPRLPPQEMECSDAQSECFRRGLVSYGTDGRCYRLLSGGPCPENQRLVFDKQESRAQRISTTCQSKRRCRRGERFMGHEQRCVNQSDIANVLCPVMNYFTDVFGDTVCRFKEEFFEVQLKSLGNGFCKFRYDVVLKKVPEVQLKPKCDSSNPLECMDLGDIDPDIIDAFDVE